MMEEGIFVFVLVCFVFFCWESEEKLAWIGVDCVFVMGR